MMSRELILDTTGSKSLTIVLMEWSIQLDVISTLLSNILNKTYRVKLQYIVYTDVTINKDLTVDEYIFDEIFWEKATNQGYDQLMNGEFEVEPLEKVDVSSKSLYDLNNEGKL